jgi:cytochrome c biogenesis protein CcdA
MIDLLLKLIPLLVFDVLNPVLFALLVVAVGSGKPFANSTAFLAGHTVSYFISGVVIAFGLNEIVDRLNNPRPVDFVIEFLVGLTCLWAAWAAQNDKAGEAKSPSAELTPAYCFGFGAIVNFTGVPFALPYFAAINQILKANLSVESSVMSLAFYNIAYALPFLMVPILIALIGERGRPFLEKTSNLLTVIVDRFMPVLLLLLGVALIGDAIAYLIMGESLW